MVTGKSCRFRFPGLAPGQYEISVRSDNRPSLKRSVTLDPNFDTLDLEFALSPKPALQILVRDELGHPRVGASVKVKLPDQAHTLKGTTDQSGLALFGGIASGTQVQIWVLPAREYLVPEPQMVIVEDTIINFDLVHVSILEGRVLTPKGQAIPGISVLAHLPNQEKVGEVWTDEAGLFSMKVAGTPRVNLSLGPMQVLAGTERRFSTYRGVLEGVLAPGQSLETVIGADRFNALSSALSAYSMPEEFIGRCESHYFRLGKRRSDLSLLFYM